MRWLQPEPSSGRLHGFPPEIIGIGFGLKRSEGKVVADRCLRIYVRRKAPKSSLLRRQLIPATLHGVPTDVIETAKIVAHAAPGDSIGTSSGNIGTLGCLVTDNANRYLLSNNHVLANLNAGAPSDPVYLPSLAQDPRAATIALLAAYPAITLDGSANRFDAAVAQIQPGTVIDSAAAGIGPISAGVAFPSSRLAVVKQGAVSGRTTGMVEAISEDVDIMFNNNPATTAHFTGQVAITGDLPPFSVEGDSGSLILSAGSNQPVALLIGGSIAGPQPCTFASPIQAILDYFRLTIVTG